MSDYFNRVRAFWGRRSRWGKGLIIVAAVLVGLAILGAAMGDDTSDTSATPTVETTTESPAPPSPPPAPEVDENERAVTADDYGKEWPLTVSGGTLRCDEPSLVTFTTADGDTWAVNGSARGFAEDRGWIDDIEPIWKDDPELAGLKVSIGPLIDDGLALCES